MNVYISTWIQDVNEIPTDLRMLSGYRYSMRMVTKSYDQTGRTGHGNSKTAASKLSILACSQNSN